MAERRNIEYFSNALEVICRVKAMLLDLIATFLPEDDIPAMQMNLKKYLPLLEFIHRDADAKTGTSPSEYRRNYFTAETGGSAAPSA